MWVQRVRSWLLNRELRLLVTVFVCVASLWAFLLIAEEVSEGEAHHYDLLVLRAMREPHDLSDPRGPAWFEESMRDFTALGGLAVLSLVVGSVAGFLALRRDHRALWLLLGATLSGVLLSLATKAFFARPRPELVPHLSHTLTSSFPSGHSTMSAVVYLTLAALLSRLVTPLRFKAYVLSVALLLTFLVGVSRVYMGVHYPSDVLAGWALGLSWAIICWLFAWFLQQRGRIP